MESSVNCLSDNTHSLNLKSLISSSNARLARSAGHRAHVHGFASTHKHMTLHLHTSLPYKCKGVANEAGLGGGTSKQVFLWTPHGWPNPSVMKGQNL